MRIALDSGVRSRGRTLLFLTLFCSFVMLGSASAADAPGQPDAATMQSSSGAPEPQAAADQSQTELKPTPPKSPDADYGASTAISGNTAVVGAPGDGGGAGSVTVFALKDGTATQQSSITPPDSNQQGFGTAVSTDGSTLAIGAPNNPDAEAVDLYDPATTALLATLLGADYVGSGSGYGSAVAVLGNWLAVGAPNSCVEEGCGEGPGDGTVIIYYRSNGVWGGYQVLNGSSESSFGSSLALDGVTLVVGAPTESIFNEENPYGLTAGAAHVFQLQDGDWVEAGDPLTDPNAIYGGGFGTAVAVQGTTFVVGAPNPSADGDPGRVVVFTDPYGTESLPPQTITGPSDGYLFGRSLALDQGNLAIGYLQSDFSGAVDLYSQAGAVGLSAAGPTPQASGPFGYQGTLHGTGPGDNYGRSLGLSGGNLVAGGNGHAYLAGAQSGGSGGVSAGLSASGKTIHGRVSPSRPHRGPSLGGLPRNTLPLKRKRVLVPPTVVKASHAKPHAAEHAGEAAHGAAEGDRSSFAASVLSPTEIDLSAANLAEGGLIAFILAALLYLPVTIFNKATEKNHETISGWLAGPRRTMAAAIERIPLATHPMALLIFTGVIGGVLFSFVEPGFPGHHGSLEYLTGMILGLVFVAIIFFGTWREVVHRLEPESEGRWRLYPPYIGLAIVLVALARLAHFLPGVVLGTLAEYEPGKRLSKRTAGLRVLITYLLLMAVGAAAWFAWIPVEHAAKEPHAGSVTLILDAALTIIFVTGLESTVFGLLPLTFLDGHDLFAWRKGLWLFLWGMGLYWFSVVILHPALSTYNEVSGAGAFWFGLLFGSLMIIALSTWAFFAIRQRRLHPAER